MFHFRFKLLLEWRWKTEAEHFILNQSDLAFPEWLLLLFTSEAAKTETTEKNILVLTKLHLFFSWKMDSINRYWLVLFRLHTAIKVYPPVPEKKLIPIAQLSIWNLWLMWTQQKITWEFPLNRNRGLSVSSDIVNLLLVGCLTAIQPFPKLAFFVLGSLYLVRLTTSQFYLSRTRLKR